MLRFIYHSWSWIAGISAIIGIVTAFFTIKSRAGHTGATGILRIAIIVLTCNFLFVSLTVHQLFTEVPDVLGQTVAIAKGKLEAARLDFKLALNLTNLGGDDPLYVVDYQSLDPGEIVLSGTTVEISYHVPDSTGETPTVERDTHESTPQIKDNSTVSTATTVVPSVVGMEQTDATSLLQLNGLQFQVWWSFQAKEDTEAYYIVSQSPSAGEQVPVGTVVELELTDSVPDQTITAEKRYTANDAMVRSAEEQRYFILKTAGASKPSKYDLDSGETSVLDYITESLCCITLHFTDLGDAEVALFYRDASTGFVLSQSDLQREIYLNKGHYVLTISTETSTVQKELNVDHSGSYTIQ